MDWEIYDGQLQRGPMPEASVFEAIRGGLPRNAYVRQAGTHDWLPIETHPLFTSMVQNRPAPGQWAPPPPPPPPALIGAPPPVVPEVQRPAPGTAYAVSGAAQSGRPTLVARGCLVQTLGALILIAAGYGLYAQVAAVVIVASVAGLGVVLLAVGGLLGLKWICSACKQPVPKSGAFMCPHCRASFT